MIKARFVLKISLTRFAGTIWIGLFLEIDGASPQFLVSIPEFIQSFGISLFCLILILIFARTFQIIIIIF